jgi:hypothetical protein
MKPKLFVVAAACLLLIGCKPAGPTVASSTGGSTASTSGTGGTTPTAPAPKLSDLPASLKTDAYDYYGLGNDQPISFEWTTSTDTTVHTGSQTFVLKSIGDKEAVFDADRTGGMADLGSEQLALRPDGVYVLSSDKAKITGDRLEIPNELTPGKTWRNHQVVVLDGRTMDVTNDWKVVGMQKFSTKAGSYEGLLISTTGKGLVDNKKVTIETKMWLVKGRGALKYALTMTMPGGEKRTVTVQEIK